MPEIRLGRYEEVLEIFQIDFCPPSCPLPAGEGMFCCIHHNGDATIRVPKGIHSGEGGTIDKFIRTAPCFTYQTPSSHS
jgi:hypothetical protein